MTLTLLDEYPRWLKKEHQISGEISSVIPIEATFTLTDDELEEIEEAYGSGVLDRDVTFFRSYAEPNDLQIRAEIKFNQFINPFLANVPERLRRAVGTVGTTTDLRQKLDQVRSAKDEDEESSAELADDADEAIAALDAVLGEGQALTSAINRILRSKVPKTFYFSTYSQLGGRYRLDEVFNAVKSGSDDESLQAAADFLELARVVPETVEEWDFEASNAELESISSLLTKRVKAHWKQNDHLRLKVSLETQKEADPHARVRVERYLQFRVEDTRHDFSSRLDRRSTGFRWFISFIASFLEFEADKNLILLLDEPGLSLHARAQMDLLDTIERKLATRRQVLYSTHSPFMVKTSALNKARITEDQGPDAGSVVLNDAGVVSDPDTLFPLQAALGYDIVQSIFIGNQNVLVEGVSDFIYISMVSEHLGSNGRTPLKTGCRLLPAGGATNIPTFIALLGGQLDVVVLLDGSTDRQRIDTSIARGRLGSSRVLVLDEFCSVPKADIEDLFSPGEYVALYNATFAKSLKMSQLKGTDRIVNRIARVEGDFNHGAVAAQFLRTLTITIKTLSPATLDRFESLIKAINAALPPV